MSLNNSRSENNASESFFMSCLLGLRAHAAFSFKPESAFWLKTGAILHPLFAGNVK
jgi:hypothetical protein